MGISRQHIAAKSFPVKQKIWHMKHRMHFSLVVELLYVISSLAEVETKVWRKKEPRYTSAKIQLEGRRKEDKYVKSNCVVYVVVEGREVKRQRFEQKRLQD